MTKLAKLDRLEERWNRCIECSDMAAMRSKVVHWRGSPDAKLAIVGEAPGADEDRKGLPFVGRSGRLLDDLLRSADLDPAEDVFVCNQLACRPPGNRNPRPEEIASCAPRLQYMLGKVVKPGCLLLLGLTAARLVGIRANLGAHRGELKTIDICSYDGNPLVWNAVITYHPSYLLRTQSKRDRGLVISDILLASGIAKGYTVKLPRKVKG